MAVGVLIGTAELTDKLVEPAGFPVTEGAV
jgi:hypothetical protein